MLNRIDTPRSDTTAVESPRSIADVDCSPANLTNPFPAPQLTKSEKCAKGLLKAAVSSVISAGIGTASYGWQIASSAPEAYITLSIVTGIALSFAGSYCMKSVDRYFERRILTRAIQADPREPRGHLDRLHGIVYDVR